MPVDKHTDMEQRIHITHKLLTDGHGQHKVQYTMHTEAHQVAAGDVPRQWILVSIEVIAIGRDERTGGAVGAQRQLDDTVAQTEGREHAEQVPQLQGLVRRVGDRAQDEGHDHEAQARDEVEEHHHDLRRGVTEKGEMTVVIRRKSVSQWN